MKAGQHRGRKPQTDRRAPLRAAALLAVLAAAGCAPQGESDGHDAGAPTVWNVVSETGAYRVEVGPRRDGVPIGQFHDWAIRLLDAGGKPVYPARIGVSGGMPGHGHGMPTQPQVTEYLGDGRYLIAGMKFNMAGRWVLVFGIESPDARDRVEVDIDLEI